MPRTIVTIRYSLLKEDLGIPLDELPALFKQYLGEKISRTAIYYWFQRGSMKVERLAQLLTVVRLQTDRRLDFWRYIDAPVPFEEDEAA